MDDHQQRVPRLTSSSDPVNVFRLSCSHPLPKARTTPEQATRGKPVIANTLAPFVPRPHSGMPVNECRA